MLIPVNHVNNCGLNSYWVLMIKCCSNNENVWFKEKMNIDLNFGSGVIRLVDFRDTCKLRLPKIEVQLSSERNLDFF